MFFRRGTAQSATELAIVLSIVIVCFIVVYGYIQRGFQARYKDVLDYSVYETNEEIEAYVDRLIDEYNQGVDEIYQIEKPNYGPWGLEEKVEKYNWFVNRAKRIDISSVPAQYNPFVYIEWD